MVQRDIHLPWEVLRMKEAIYGKAESFQFELFPEETPGGCFDQYPLFPGIYPVARTDWLLLSYHWGDFGAAVLRFYAGPVR
jgi:hypothetical protein